MYAAVTVTLSRDEMERRRLEAAEDLQKGITQARVARKFGVSRTTASRWYRILEGQGMERLRKRKAVLKPTAGPPPGWHRRSKGASPSGTIRTT